MKKSDNWVIVEMTKRKIYSPEEFDEIIKKLQEAKKHLVEHKKSNHLLEESLQPLWEQN